MNLRPANDIRRKLAHGIRLTDLGLDSSVGCSIFVPVGCVSIHTHFTDHLFRTPSLVGQVLADSEDLSDSFFGINVLVSRQGFAAWGLSFSPVLHALTRMCFLPAPSIKSKKDQAGCEQYKYGQRLLCAGALRPAAKIWANRPCMGQGPARLARRSLTATSLRVRRWGQQPIRCIARTTRPNVTEWSRRCSAPHQTSDRFCEPRLASAGRGQLGCAQRAATSALYQRAIAPMAGFSRIQQMTGMGETAPARVLPATLTQIKDTTCSTRS